MGATGLIGKALTEQLLADPYYTTVKVLVRNKIELTHPKLQQILYDYEQPQADVLDAKHVYCCLGTTIKKAGSPEAFRRVDYEYVVQTAALAQERGARRLTVVSSMGADTDSNMLYSRVKGEMEAALQAQGWETLYIVRPSLLLGERDEFRLGESLGKMAAKGLSFLIPDQYKGIEASQVAKAMHYYLTQGQAGQHVIESDELRDV